MTPQKISAEDLANLLKEIAGFIEQGDSAEGYIMYTYSNEPNIMEVSGSYRIGNKLGQGGVILIGDIDGK